MIGDGQKFSEASIESLHIEVPVHRASLVMVAPHSLQCPNLSDLDPTVKYCMSEEGRNKNLIATG